MKKEHKIKKEIEGKCHYYCISCKELLSNENFTIDKNNKARDGLSSKCIYCKRKYDQIIKGYKTNRINQIPGDKLFCTKCNKYLDLDEFWNYSANSHRLNKNSYCKKCCEVNNDIRNSKLTENDSISKILKSRFNSATVRSKNRNIDINISILDIENLWKNQDGKCAISKINMSTSVSRGRDKFSISLDRIDSSKGYIVGSIQLVCDIVNRMKLDTIELEFVSLCKTIYMNNKNRLYHV